MSDSNEAAGWLTIGIVVLVMSILFGAVAGCKMTTEANLAAEKEAAEVKAREVELRHDIESSMLEKGYHLEESADGSRTWTAPTPPH